MTYVLWLEKKLLLLDILCGYFCREFTKISRMFILVIYPEPIECNELCFVISTTHEYAAGTRIDTPPLVVTGYVSRNGSSIGHN